MFYYLYQVPRSMGHDVDFFDYRIPWEIAPDHMRRQFLTLLKGGAYDAVFIATFLDEFDRETLEEAKRHAVTFAWNSDDEWRWNDYSAPRVDWYSFMVTNSPDVFEANRAAHPSLLHSQWACTGFWDGRTQNREIGFSFVGQAYGQRLSQVRYLGRTAGLVAWGKGMGRLWVPPKAPARERVKRLVQAALLRRIAPTLLAEWTTLPFETVNQIWNASRVSFTPLESSSKNVLQIKSRVFDMGMSGSLMLAPRGAGVDRYYEPGREFVEYDDLDDCAGKARFYLAHEQERAKIAQAYARRTLNEHLWRHRIEGVLESAGMAAEARRRDSAR